MRHPRFAATLALITLAAPAVVAQAPSATPAPHSCFRGRPLAECSGFWITEFSVATPLGRGWDEIDHLPLFTAEFGGMKNVGRATALGATVLFEQSGLGADRVGIAPRFRHWLTRDVGLDFSAGVTSIGWLGRAGVSFGDYLGGSLQVERHHNPSGFTTTTWYLGGRLGGVPGLAANVGALAFLLVLASALGGSD